MSICRFASSRLRSSALGKAVVADERRSPNPMGSLLPAVGALQHLYRTLELNIWLNPLNRPAQARAFGFLSFDRLSFNLRAGAPWRVKFNCNLADSWFE
jgi:hypothetical protein